MKADKAISQMCCIAQMGTLAVSKEIGRNRSHMGNMLSRGSTLQANTLAKIAGACDYELQLVGRGEIIQIDPE